MKRNDHGLSEIDIEEFIKLSVCEAVEFAWLWANTTDEEMKLEMQERVLNTLVSVYMLNMWSDLSFRSEESE